MDAVFDYVFHMLPIALIALPFVIAARIWSSHHLAHSKKPSLLHEVGCTVLVLFLISLAGETIVPKEGLREFSFSNFSINLMPFRIIADTFTLLKKGDTVYLTISFLGNIFIFSPIGFFLPLLWRQFERLSTTISAAFFISFLIEIIQLPLARSSDIDDLILNTLGVVPGFLLWLLFHKLFPHLSPRFRSAAD